MQYYKCSRSAVKFTDISTFRMMLQRSGYDYEDYTLHFTTWYTTAVVVKKPSILSRVSIPIVIFIIAISVFEGCTRGSCGDADLHFRECEDKGLVFVWFVGVICTDTCKPTD